jgi:CRISPR-associated endonuclease/helicase Cas3
MDLSACLAKSRVLEDGRRVPGVDVYGHCVIVGEVAKALMRYYVPALRGRLFPEGSELVAAVHDVGKLEPGFQERIHRAIEGYRPNSLPGLEGAGPGQEMGGHAAVSQFALHGCAPYVPEIAGMHHGYGSRTVPAGSEIFGDGAWKKLRARLIKKLRARFAASWPEITGDRQAALVAGLTCVADWIGSGPAFDGIERVEELDRAGELPGRAEAALGEAGFVPPALRKGLSFGDVFGFDPHPVQSRFYEALSGPGLYVLEAPMGMGKTEAALYGAYRVLAAGKAGGIYFALPTRLTSNKIHDRVDAFLAKILDPASPRHSSRLLHSSAWLYGTGLGGEGQPGGDWFDSRKRRILAPFGVGTIDQALMAVMNVKHGFVRAFGLAGKVVILDEVHSYDSYTGVILDSLVRGLRELGCTVIILSATLTEGRRRELMEGEDGGSRAAKSRTTGSKAAGSKTAGGALDGAPGGALGEGGPASAYPLISYIREKDRKITALPVESPAPRRVTVGRADTGAAVEEVLKRAEAGQQTLWIENTVAQAQAVYYLLSARAGECGVEVGLLHSRFTQADRERNEQAWVGLYGAGGRERRGERGRILVGTQVLEQSLDIDADFLITRLCPTDMLLQRTGRLWRHDGPAFPQEERPRGARAEVWILTADYGQVIADYKTELGKSALVYDPYVLLRTLMAWEGRGVLMLPADIRPLVEETYRERDEDGLMGKLKSELETKRDRLQRLARLGLGTAYKAQPDVEAKSRYAEWDSQRPEVKTRYTELETIDTLLLREAEKDGNGDVSLVFTDGTSLCLPRGLKGNDHGEWRKRAAALSRHIVTVPEPYAPLPAQRRFLEWFRDYLYIGNGTRDEEDILRVALVDGEGRLRGKDGAAVQGDYALSYDGLAGYRAEKKKGGGP